VFEPFAEVPLYPLVFPVFWGAAIFFTLAAFIQLALSGRRPPHRGSPSADRWDWWGSAVQFAGTLFFNLSTGAALVTALNPDTRVGSGWAPDALGSICFLVASHLAWIAVCNRLWCVRRDDRDWWSNALNYVGSIFFMLSAIASLTLTTTGQMLNTTIVNTGTFLGAGCFFVGAYLLCPPDE
jgi:drug/metabolite transporter (DMT)-like permease